VDRIHLLQPLAVETDGLTIKSNDDNDEVHDLGSLIR
jgi:hypothetical protein